MNIVQLFARIGLKTDEEKAKSFSRAMTTVKIGLIATTAIATGTALAIRKITSEAMEAAVAFKQFETETGASSQQLQRWQSVAEQTNQTAESVTSAIKSIVSNQEKIKLGQGDISGYQILGIDPRQDPFKIMEELREKTKGLSEGMKKNILSQMGVGVGMLQTLRLTREEFDEMAGRAWIISPQAIKTLNKTKASMDLVGRAIKYMKAQIAVGLAPQIKEIVKDFQAWMKVNEKGIVKGFKAAFTYVVMFTKAVYNSGLMIGKVISFVIELDLVLEGLVGVLLILNRSLIFSPLGLFIAKIVLLVAVLDDLYVYSQGGKSLFGEMMKEFPELEKTLFGSFKVIRDVFKLLKAFGKGDEATIKKITSEWGKFGEIVSGAYENIRDFIKLLKSFASGDESGIEDITEKWGKFGKVIEWIYKKFKELKEFVADFKFPDLPELSSFIELPEKLADDSSLLDKLAYFENIKLLGGGSGGGDTTQNNSITVNVTGNGDPVATGNAAAKAMQREINAASAQLSRDQ